jgi:hypothetical protein
MALVTNGKETQRFYPPVRIYPVNVQGCRDCCRIKVVGKDSEVTLEIGQYSRVNEEAITDCSQFLGLLDNASALLASDDGTTDNELPQIEVVSTWVVDNLGRVLWMEGIYNEMTEITMYKFYDYPNGLRIIPDNPVRPLTSETTVREWLGEEVIDLVGAAIETLTIPNTANLAEIYVQDSSQDSVMFRLGVDPTPDTGIIQDPTNQFELENYGEMLNFRAASLTGNLVRLIVNYYNAKETNA